MKTQKKTAIEIAHARMEELAQEAKALVDDHWENHYLPEGKKRRDFTEKPKVFPRYKKNSLGPAIEWYLILKWYRDHNKNWRKKNKYLSRGRRYRVTLAEKHAQPWEADVICVFEDKAEVIRQEVEVLSRIIQAYNRAQKKAATKKAVKK